MTDYTDPGLAELQAFAQRAELASMIARQMAMTAFLPDSLRVYENPDAPVRDRIMDLDKTIASGTMAILTGQTLGLKPEQAVRAIVVIKGTPSIMVGAVRGLLQAHGHDLIVTETTSTRAVIAGHRREWPEDRWLRWTYGIEQAKARHLYPGDEKSEWRRNPKGMLVARVTGEAGRQLASDVLFGLYTDVEIRDDIPDSDEDIRPEETTAPGPSTGPAAPADGAPNGGARRRGAAALLTGPAVAGPPPQITPDQPAEPAEPEPLMNPRGAQMRALHATLRSHDLADRAAGLAKINEIIGREKPVTSTSQLTVAEGRKILDYFADPRDDDAPPPDEPERN